jgi:hypothetical protein
VPRHILTRAHGIGAFWSNASSSQARRTDANGRLCGKSAAAQYASAPAPPGHSHMTLALKRTLRPRDVPETDTVGGTLTSPTHVERIRPGESIACECFAIRSFGTRPPIGQVATGRITAKTESLTLSRGPIPVHNPHRKIRATVTAIAPERREDENSNCHHSG